MNNVDEINAEMSFFKHNPCFLRSIYPNQQYDRGIFAFSLYLYCYTNAMYVTTSSIV